MTQPHQHGDHKEDHTQKRAERANLEDHSPVHAHDRHAGHSVDMFRNRFWVSTLLTIPVVAYAHMLWNWAGVDPPRLPAPKVIPFALGTSIYVYGGSIFLRSALGELKTRMPGMMTLVSIGITSAYLYSAATTFFLETEGFYWELATLVDIMLLGHWIEMRSIGRAQGALGELAKLLPDTAERIANGEIENVPIASLVKGDLVLIRPGGRVPADAYVQEGQSHVDESLLTGESRPVRKSSGDTLIAGSINQEGSLRSSVTKTGEETALAGIARLVAEAQASKSRAQTIADRAAMVLTYVAIAAGILTATIWITASGRDLDFIAERTVTVIVIACPHALGLAVPLVISISTSLAAQSGLLIRNRLALEQAKELDVVVFDKTGTLTEGKLGVTDVLPLGEASENDVLAKAAAIEADSEHAVAKALLHRANQEGLRIPKVESFEAIAGRGVKARLDGKEAYVGGPRILESLELKPPVEAGTWIEDRAREGKSLVYLISNGQVLGVVALADVIRKESKEAVSRLRDAGVRVAIITGDSEDVAKWVAAELQIDEYFAQVLPENKAASIKDLQSQGKKVAMVGDGVNDAPALTQADVGIAIGAGTDVAIESADVILVRDDPRDVPKVMELSRASYRKMVQNLVWATGYNVVAIPLAAGVLAPFGIFLAPAVGALLMSASTVVVAANAQLLRRQGK